MSRKSAKSIVRKMQAARLKASAADCWLGRSIAHSQGLDASQMTQDELLALGGMAIVNRPKDPPQPINGDTPCPNCGSTARAERSRPFQGGAVHNEVRCAKCRKFLKWGNA